MIPGQRMTRNPRRKRISDVEKDIKDVLEEQNDSDTDMKELFDDFVNEEDDKDEELDSIKAFLESLENDKKNKSVDLSDTEVTELILTNLVTVRSRRGNNILAVDISKSEYEFLEEKGILPFSTIEEYDLKMVSNVFSDSKVDLKNKNKRIEKFFVLDKVDANILRDFSKKLMRLTCVPNQFTNAVKTNFANDYNYKEQVFKYEILDSFLKDNTFDDKEQYIAKLNCEISIIKSCDFIKKEFLDKFYETYELLNSYSLDDIKYYTRLIK